MNNLLFKTALKWSLLALGASILASIPMLIFDQGGMVLTVILSILNIFFLLAVYIIAILEFSKKRNHRANVGEIFGLSGLIFGITLIGGIVWSSISFKFFTPIPAELGNVDGFDATAYYFASMGMSSLISFALALAGIQLAGIWRTFQKAGKAGWESIVPVYNYCVMAEIGKNPVWWGILVLIPLVNIVFVIMILNGVAKAFGKDVGWTVGLIFLGFIFWPLLAWGGAKYIHGDFEDEYEPDVSDHLVE